MKEGAMVKVQVFCPKNVVDIVRIAIGDAGGGAIGSYSHCAFVSEGKGYFIPLAGARPHIGTVGGMECVVEMKIEFLCEMTIVKKVVEAIKQVHPYEEVPIDVYPVLDIE